MFIFFYLSFKYLKLLNKFNLLRNTLNIYFNLLINKVIIRIFFVKSILQDNYELEFPTYIMTIFIRGYMKTMNKGYLGSRINYK